VDDNKLKDFCENYEVRVLNDSKRRARYHPPQFFTDPKRADIITRNMTYETEYVYTVEIPEGRFRALVELEQRFFKWQHHSRGEVDMFQTLIDKEREEAFYRNSNEAVRKAYEQYSIMLNLAGYQRKI
jgi:hypothetical protein